MDAADAARRKDLQVRVLTGQHRARDRSPTVSALHDHRGKVARPHLMHVILIGESLEFGIAEAHMELSIQKRDGGWGCATITNRLLHVESQLQILRPRQSMSEDGGFEGDDRLSRCDPFTDFI